ncbi:toll-like receptor 7 [Topomyia yanbarensis]|uniref:toll-like receptor 7 n=1 Tax=Topomyia yanbarensis TaxID=2498891 RepID=UPI00273CEE76|nr:toll-like receptor 7 [Topomyia yanbarensis]
MLRSICYYAAACCILLLTPCVTYGRADTAQMVEICTLCRCLEDTEESSIVVDCLGKSWEHHQRPSNYFDLRNIVWPVGKDAASDRAPKVRAFFKDLNFPYLPKIPTSVNVVELYFQNDSIQSLPTEPFGNFKNLETLTITNNNLNSIEKDFFALKNKLVHLDLSNNSLTTVTALERAWFESLEVIDLSYNKLITVSAQLIRSLQNASIVRLAGCEIYHWNSETVTRWKVLNLNWNKLSSVSTSTFAGLEQLEALYLSHNNIRSIESHAFEGMQQLERLDVSHNEIVNLEANLVLPTTLEMINVAYNGIERWPFAEIPDNLRIMNLRNNGLFEINPGHSVKVVILEASHNRLETFLGDSFPELTELDLSFNLLTDVPRNLGQTLSTLILDGNPMERIFFESKTPLKMLSLNAMPNLEELAAFAFWKLVGVDDLKERDCVEVRISNCPKLRRIDSMAFAEENNLCKLDLSYNQLTSIPQNLTEWYSLYGGVNLQGNPLNCNCSEQWLVDEILPLLYEKDELQYLLDDLRCASPVERRGKRLVKYLNHRGAFCGGPKMERLQMAPVNTPRLDRSDEIVQAGFGNILCSVDDDQCLHAHDGWGMIIVAAVVTTTTLLSIVMIIFIAIRRREERRRAVESVWLMR